MIYVTLANGFEEIEALAVVDILRRAELDVLTVGIGGKTVRGSHGIVVAADIGEDEVRDKYLKALILPGGMPGTLRLERSETVSRLIDTAMERNLLIGAICAAPSILGHKGLLKGRRATCFPGFEQELFGAEVLPDAVVEDGQIVTAKGAGAAVAFGLCLVKRLAGEAEAKKLQEAMQCP